MLAAAVGLTSLLLLASPFRPLTVEHSLHTAQLTIDRSLTTVLLCCLLTCTELEPSNSLVASSTQLLTHSIVQQQQHYCRRLSTPLRLCIMSLFGALAATVPALGTLWDPDLAQQRRLEDEERQYLHVLAGEQRPPVIQLRQCNTEHRRA